MSIDIKKLLGETTDYDKKEALEEKKPKSWCKSVSAFANGTGGRLYFGINNDGKVVGLKDAAHTAEKISELINACLDPIPDVHLSIEDVDGKQIVIVDVKAGEETPYYYVKDGQQIAFVRVGNESIPAEPTKLRRLVLKGSGKTFDSLKSKYSFSDMAFTKMKSVYLQRTGRKFEDTYYASWDIVDDKGNLTNAGALLADECPIYQSRLFCTRWNGLTKASGVMDALDDEEYNGGLVNLLQDGMDFVSRNSRKAWKKTAEGRIEYPDYPERAVHEGIVNALIHRDYLEIGSEVHIDIFDDRIEIYSPGGMIDNDDMISGNLRKIPSRRRNPIIADIFSRMLLMERRGSGFDKINDAYRVQQNITDDKMPQFENKFNSFILTLWNLNYQTSVISSETEHEETLSAGGAQTGTQDGTQSGTKAVGHKVITEDLKIKIRTEIKRNNKVSQAEMAKTLGVGRRTIARAIKEMDDIAYIGSGYSGHWEVRE